MSYEMTSFTCLQFILPRPKNHILSYCIGQRIDCLRRLSLLCIRMHPDLAEILSEAWLHESVGSRIKGLTRRA